MDLSIVVDNQLLNIRVGVIMKYDGKTLIEIPKEKGNSVIPGGRVKIGENTKDALKREIKEEMGITLNKNKMIFKSVLENFFMADNRKVHELFFVYEYSISNNEYQKIIKIKKNLDSGKTYFSFLKNSEFNKVNLLPKEVISIIKKAN